MATFHCMICMDDHPLCMKMPATSLGCSPCTGEICNSCFCKDLEERSKVFYVTQNPGSEDGQRLISNWPSMMELGEYLCTEKDLTEEEDEQLHFAIEANNESGDETLVQQWLHMMKNKYVQIGRTCPFCRATCMWKMEELPHISPTTNMLTFHSPSNVMRGVWPTIFSVTKK